MLFITFKLGADRYALDALQVAEVLPLVTLKQIPHAPPAVAGIFNYHGQPVPVIDLVALTLGRHAEPLLSTRLILVHYQPTNTTSHLLGLIAEKATDTLRGNAEEFVSPGITHAKTSYLGNVAPHPPGFIQRIDIHQLLPPELQALLFQSAISP